MARAVGIDLGGSTLRAALVDDSHAIVAHHRELLGEPRDPLPTSDPLSSHRPTT